MENIIQDSDNLVFVSWKDQKEGIFFIENKSYKKKTEADLSKAEQLQREIDNVEKDIKKKNEDITKLSDKETFYIDEIEKLNQEYEQAKTQALDEGHALGFAAPVLKEFK